MPSGPVRNPEMLRPGRNGSTLSSAPRNPSSRLPKGSLKPMRSLTRRPPASAQRPSQTATPAPQRPQGVPPEELAALPMCGASGRRVGQLFGHLDQKLACLAALDLVERLDDAHRTRGLHEAEDALGVARRFARRCARRAAEEE